MLEFASWECSVISERSYCISGDYWMSKETDKVIVKIDLSAQKVELFYAGRVQSVQAYTSDGRTVSIPINILTKYVTPGGIFGTFEIEYTNLGARKKFKRIRKIR